MANHKSAKKRIRTTARRRIVNQMSESKIKTSIKKVLSTTDKTEAETPTIIEENGMKN